MFRMPTKVEYNPLMKRWQILRKIDGRGEWERVRYGFRTRAEARKLQYWYAQPHTPA